MKYLYILVIFSMHNFVHNCPLDDLYQYNLRNQIPSKSKQCLDFSNYTEEDRLINHQSTVITDNKNYNVMFLLQIEQSETFNELFDIILLIQNIPAQLIQLQKLSPSKLEQEPKIITPKPEPVPNLTPSQDVFSPIQIGIGFQTSFWNKIFKTQHKKHQQRYGKYGEIPQNYYNNLIAFHIKCDSKSLCYKAVQMITQLLKPITRRIIHELHGFRNFDFRGAEGFIDGTHNAPLLEARKRRALNIDGSSYMLHQIWQEDLNKWNEFTLEEQQKIIGRSKQDSIEEKILDKESHISRNILLDANGNHLGIFRQSLTYGNVNSEHHGLNYIGYASNIEILDLLLDRMTGNTEDKLNDAIMKFTKAIFSDYFYIPSRSQLNNYKN